MTVPMPQQIAPAEIKKLSKWAESRKTEAEQLALDSVRLLSCTGERMERLSNQGFFQRCWSHFSGKTGAVERANANDLIKMQGYAYSYINMLEEKQLLMADSMLSLKNNLLSLAIKEGETRDLVTLLAKKTAERFAKLEGRVDQLEISTNLQGWLLGLEEREYDTRIPTEYMRLFRIINDYYAIKDDAWNYNDFMFMRKAIRTVGLDPKKKLSISKFIDTLTDEILQQSVGFDRYQEAISQYQPDGVKDYSDFIVQEISSPVFVCIHGVKTQFIDKREMVEELRDEMNIAPAEALKRILRRSIGNMNVNLEYELPLAETAMEILLCMRLVSRLASNTGGILSKLSMNKKSERRTQ